MEFSANSVYRGYHLLKPRHANTALSGEGSMLGNGRWHTKGCRVIYSASSIALAALEMRVQAQPMGINYLYVELEIPGGLIEKVADSKLPADWRELSAYPACQQIGMSWVSQKRSAALAVRSAVINLEWNFLINIEHEDFSEIGRSEPRPIEMDPRLINLIKVAKDD